MPALLWIVPALALAGARAAKTPPPPALAPPRPKGARTQSGARSHMRGGAPRRTNGIGGKASGTPVARFLVHPSTMPARLEYMRSEERRVGKEGRSRWSPYH